MDPHRSQGQVLISELPFSRLTQYDETMMDPQPDLAESWTVSEDGKTIVFKLREDVRFHTGRQLKAEDVVYSWNRCRNQIADRGRCKGQLTDVASFEATGEYEFTVILDRVSVVFLAFGSSHFSLAVVDRDTIDQIDTHPIGSGPYKFVENIPGDRIIYELNLDYYDKAVLAKRPDRVIFTAIEEPLTRVAALKNGEVDLIYQVPYYLVEDIRNTSGLELLTTPGGVSASYMTIIFNVREGPMADVRVRKAFQLAIDTEAIHQAAFFGVGETGCSLIPKAHWAYTPISCPTRDIAKAKALLAEAGYPNGLTLQHYPESFDFTIKMAEMLKQMVADAGIDLVINVVESSQWLDAVWFGVDDPDGYEGVHKTFDVADAYYGRAPDPDGLMQTVLRATSDTGGWKGNNGMRYFNQEVEDLFDAGKATTDREERRRIYTRIVDIVANEDVPLIKVQTMPGIFAANAKVQDGYVSVRSYWNSMDYTFVPLSK
jgi:peptide/nickel transport system substrate-binding protein